MIIHYSTPKATNGDLLEAIKDPINKKYRLSSLRLRKSHYLSKITDHIESDTNNFVIHYKKSIYNTLYGKFRSVRYRKLK